ncbi:MAG: hypothetical protein ACYTDY_09355 [Planctomycetota bacterium]|jgi:ribosomal protein S27AE
MELRFACPQCGTESRLGAAEESSALTCGRCDYVGLLPLDWISEEKVERCPICGATEFFRQKDFHQRLALVIGLVGLALVFFTRYVSVFAAGAAILVLYLLASEILVCYLCRTQILGHRVAARHRRFDRRIEERVRKERNRGADRQNSEKGVR